MTYNLSLTVFTQRNFVADFLQAKCVGKRQFCVFDPPSGISGQRTMFILGSLETCSVLPTSVNCTFLLGATAEALRANVD